MRFSTRKTIGSAMLVAGPLILFFSASARYDPNACGPNGPALGLHCTDSPAPQAWVAAIILFIAGMVTLAPWWLRWVGGFKPPQDEPQDKPPPAQGRR